MKAAASRSAGVEGSVVSGVSVARVGRIFSARVRAWRYCWVW